MDIPERIKEIIEPTVDSMGFDIVRVVLSGKRQPRLQVMAETKDGSAMTVDHCAALSRAISAALDAADPIAGSYTLEVSSPGIDRPLVRLSDFERFLGFEARLEMEAPIDGRRKFRGRLAGVDGEDIRISADGREFTLPHSGIRRAKLMLTDDLLAAAKQ